MPDGYLKCKGRLRGCPVNIHARGLNFLAVDLLERRGIWSQGETITIEVGELRTEGSGSTGNPMFDDLPVGKRGKSKLAYYTSDEKFAGKKQEPIYSNERG